MVCQITAGRFVGRAQELARLRDLLARAAMGEPLVALVGGEAGSARPGWPISWPGGPSTGTAPPIPGTCRACGCT
jgi:hypothetical protein